jgi:hypothetical protein
MSQKPLITTRIRLFTPVLQSAYLKVLSQTGNHVMACEITGLRRDMIKRELARNEQFAAAVEEAKATAAERLEGEAYRRAVLGVEEPVFFEGRRVDTVRKYSDNLLSKLLEANDPRYSSRLKLTGEKGGPVEIKHDLTNLSDDDLEKLEALLTATRPGVSEG